MDFAESVPLFGPAAKVFGIVLSSALKAKANKKNCCKLAARVFLLTRDLNDNGFFEREIKNERFDDFKSKLNEINGLIESFSSKNWLKRFISSGSDEVIILLIFQNKFSGINNEMTVIVAELSLVEVSSLRRESSEWKNKIEKLKWRKISRK